MNDIGPAIQMVTLALERSGQGPMTGADGKVMDPAVLPTIQPGEMLGLLTAMAAVLIMEQAILKGITVSEALQQFALRYQQSE